jgi:ribosomal subunit interface protein
VTVTYQIVSMSEAVEVTAEVERDILDKIGKLDKFLTRLDDDTFFIRIQLDRDQRNPHWVDAQVRLTLPQDMLIGHAAASTAAHAVHLAVRELEAQLRDYKQLTHPANPMIS